MFIDTSHVSQAQPSNDPGTTKLLDDHKGPPGLECPLGRHFQIKRKKKKRGGSKSRAGFGNSCSASM